MTESPPDSPRPGALRILLAEDEAPVREIVARTLRRHGYAVEETHDGREALQRWKEAPEDFDLVLTDVVMPNMGGWELGQRLRELRRDVRVIYMSGYAEEVLAQHGLTASDDLPLLQKPFAPRELLAVLRDRLDRT
jgi:two-component system, cell cycle sensor histidine kinase and response regulator CckA